MRWSMLRYDSRTFTAQQDKMLKGDVTRKEIPEKYIYIDDGCFRADGRMREVILPPNCKIIDRKSTRLNSSHSGQSRMPSSA